MCNKFYKYATVSIRAIGIRAMCYACKMHSRNIPRMVIRGIGFSRNTSITILQSIDHLSTQLRFQVWTTNGIRTRVTQIAYLLLYHHGYKLILLRIGFFQSERGKKTRHIRDKKGPKFIFLLHCANEQQKSTNELTDKISFVRSVAVSSTLGDAGHCGIHCYSS